MVVRLAIIAVIALVLLLGMRYWPRRRGANMSGVPRGLTLVTSSTCTECVRAREALTQAGAEFVVVDAHDAASIGIRTMSVPVAVVGNGDGVAIMVRRGTAIAADAQRLAAAAVALHAI
jgi:glutaredoxin